MEEFESLQYKHVIIKKGSRIWSIASQSYLIVDTDRLAKVETDFKQAEILVKPVEKVEIPNNGKTIDPVFKLVEVGTDEWKIDRSNVTIYELIEKQNEVASVDIKYTGIPNICFSLLNPDDEREPEYRKQRIERGFDDSETWDLSGTIVAFILPRLKRYQEIANQVLIRKPELVEDIDTVIKAFEIYRTKESFSWTKEESELVDKGFDLFPNIIGSLWW